MVNIIDRLNVLRDKIVSFMGERTDFGVPNVTRDTDVAHFDYASLSSMLHYESYDERNAIFHNKESIGFVLEATTLLGADEKTTQVLARIITDMLPQDADLQFLLWGSDKVGTILDNFVTSRDETYAEMASNRCHYLKQGAHQSLTQNGTQFIRDFRLFISVSMPNKGNNKNALIQLRDNMVSALLSIHMYTRNIAIHDFISVILDLLHPREDIHKTTAHWNRYQALNEQMIRTDRAITVYPTYLSFQSEHETCIATTYNVREFPEQFALWQMDDGIGHLYDKVNQIPCPFLISFHVRLVKNKNSGFLTSLKAIDTEKSANSKQRFFLTHLVKKSQEINFIQSRLDEGDKLVQTYFQITLFSTPKQIVTVENALVSLYEGLGFKLQKITKLQWQSFLLALPMRMTEMVNDLKLFGRFYTMTAFNAANLVPVLSEWKGTKTPHLLFVGRRGQLAPFSPFDNERGNFNLAIAALSGSGKSVLGQEYVNGLRATGGKVWVIDIGRSFQHSSQLAGATFIDFDPARPICMNPFSKMTKCEEEEINLLKPLLATMARPSSQPSDEEFIYIEQAIKAVWQEHYQATSITRIANWLSNHTSPIANNLALLLYSYTADGMYAPYFEGEAQLNLDDPFTVLELENIEGNPQFLRMLLMLLMLQIKQSMLFGSKLQTKTILIDEYWRYSKDDSPAVQIMGKFIAELARTLRKYNGSLVTIVQSVSDYFTNPSAMAVYNNSDFLITLSQKAETIDHLSLNHQLSLNPLSEKLYKSIEKTNEYAECIIKGPAGLSVHRLILDPYARVLYSSKGEEVQAIKYYQSQGLSLMDAVKRVMDGGI